MPVSVIVASALLTFVAGVGYQWHRAFEVFDPGGWTALAVVGIIAIVRGSMLERHGAVLEARLGNWRGSARSDAAGAFGCFWRSEGPDPPDTLSLLPHSQVSDRRSW
ncbi:MAG: hypothetical protein WB783_05370 [Arenicellales bacterium]